jgi:hypothetical protein
MGGFRHAPPCGLASSQLDFLHGFFGKDMKPPDQDLIRGVLAPV